MWKIVLVGIAIPFLGTALGSACVFFIKRELSRNVQRALTGFAGGVMVAASIWSLLLPAMVAAVLSGRLLFQFYNDKIHIRKKCGTRSAENRRIFDDEQGKDRKAQ